MYQPCFFYKGLQNFLLIWPGLIWHSGQIHLKNPIVYQCWDQHYLSYRASVWLTSHIVWDQRKIIMMHTHRYVYNQMVLNRCRCNRNILFLLIIRLVLERVCSHTYILSQNFQTTRTISLIEK